MNHASQLVPTNHTSFQIGPPKRSHKLSLWRSWLIVYVCWS